jgi:hypothetical protein
MSGGSPTFRNKLGASYLGISANFEIEVPFNTEKGTPDHIQDVITLAARMVNSNCSEATILAASDMVLRVIGGVTSKDMDYENKMIGVSNGDKKYFIYPRSLPYWQEAGYYYVP